MGLSGAERQRLWRQRHKGEPTAAQLKAKLAELEASVQPQPAIPATAARFRLWAEQPPDQDGAVYGPDDWSTDEDIVQGVIDCLTDRTAVVGGVVKPLLACLPDLLERAAPQFIDACRRQVALDEQAAIRKAEAKAAKRKRPPSRRTVQPALQTELEAARRRKVKQIEAAFPKIAEEAREVLEKLDRP